MALQSLCARALPIKSFTRRSFHLGISQAQPQDLAGLFSEVFSTKPDGINSLMNLIYTRAPLNNVTPFNLFCRSTMERWTIKGLRIGEKDKNNRSVVVAAGMQAHEYTPIGVALYAAAVLSQRPIKGVEISFFPVLKPKEFELQWHNEQTGRTKGPYTDGINLALEEYEWIVDGPLRSYALKRGTSFVDFVMDMTNAGSSLNLKQNSLSRPFRQANMMLQDITSQPSGCFTPRIAIAGERSLFDQLIRPPTVVIELRDKNKGLNEGHIAARAEELLSNIHTLVEETTSTSIL